MVDAQKLCSERTNELEVKRQIILQALQMTASTPEIQRIRKRTHCHCCSYISIKKQKEENIHSKKETPYLDKHCSWNGTTD